MPQDIKQITEQQAVAAARFFHEPDTDDETRQRLQRLLNGYTSQQKSLGEPIFPELKKAKRERSKRLRDMFQQPKHGFSEERYRDMKRTFRNNPEGEARFFNDEMLSNTYNVGSAELQNPSIRAKLIEKYSSEVWGESVLSETAFRENIKADYDAEDIVNDWAQSASLKFKSPMEAITEMPDHIANNAAFKRQKGRYLDMFKTTHANTNSRVSPHRALVQGMSEQLRAKAGVDQPRDGSETFADLSGMLVAVPPENLNIVLSAIIENSGDGEDKSGFISGTAQKLAENFGRGARDMGFDSVAFSERDVLLQIRNDILGGAKPKEGQSAGEFVSELRSSILESGTPIGWGIGGTVMGNREGENFLSEEQEAALANIDQRQRAIDIHKRLREISDQDVDPAKGENIVTNGVYQAVRSLPYMATAISGVPGFGLVALSLSEESYNQLRQENPEMSSDTAMAISGPIGVVKASFERVSGKIFTGKLPVVERFLNKVVVTKGSVAGRYFLRAGTGTVLEIGQENVQDVAPFVAQQLLTAFSEDMPDVPWQKIYGDMAKNQPELLFAILPLTLVGAGAGTIQDFRGAKAMMKDRHALRALGVSEANAERVAKAANVGTPKEAQSALRDALASVNGDSKQIRQVRSEALVEMMRERRRRTETKQLAEDYDILPAIRKEENGYTLRFKDGSVSDVIATSEEAHEAAFQLAHENNIPVTEALRDAIQQAGRDWEVGRQIRFVFDPTRDTVEDREAVGEVSPEAAERRKKVAAEHQARGREGVPNAAPAIEIEESVEQVEQDSDKAQPLTVDNAKAVADEYKKAVVTSELEAGSAEESEVVHVILGENENDYQEGIHTTTIKLFKDASPLTVFEEKIEGDADALIQDGKRDWLLFSLREWEAVSGDTLFAEGAKDEDLSDGDIKQAYADLGMGFVVGKAKRPDENSTGTDGSKTWLNQEFRDKAAKMMSTQLGSAMTGYGEFFRGVWKRAALLKRMEREGKVNAELAAELAKSVGLTEQNEFDAGTVEEAKKLKEAIEDSGAIEEDLPFPTNEESKKEKPDTSSNPLDDIDDNAPFSVVRDPGTEVAKMFSPFMTSPEQRIKIATEMRYHGMKLANEWQQTIAARRTGADIEDERKDREAEIIEEKMDSELSDTEKTALYTDLADVTPLQDKLALEGGVKSKTQSKKEGESLNDYDEMPTNLPPSFFGGWMTPDRAAQYLGFDYVGDMWAEIASERKGKAVLAKEQAKVKKRVKELEAEAKAESMEWAKEEKEKSDRLGSDRKILIGALRTLNAITSALPDKVQVKIGGPIKLAQLKTPDAMLKELERRTKAIDRHLEVYLKKEADKGMKALMKKVRNAQDRTPGKPLKVKADGEMILLFNKLHDIMQTKADGGWSSQQGRDEADKIQSQIDRGEIEPEDIAMAQISIELIPLFSGWHGREETKTINGVKTRIKTEHGAGAAQKMKALESASFFWKEGKKKWLERQKQVREFNDNLRQGGIADVEAMMKKPRTRDQARAKDQKSRSFLRRANYSNMSWDGFLRWFMGDDSSLYKRFSDAERIASNNFTDRVIDVNEGIEGLFTDLANGNRLKGQRLQAKMSVMDTEIEAQRDDLIVEGKPVNENRLMSQSEMITVMLYWRQEDGRRHMMGRQDDEGNIISTWSYDQEFVDEVQDKMTPEAWAVLDYITDQYAKEYDRVNEVYRKIFGTNMPRNDFYSPLSLLNEIQQDNQVDPLTGFFSGGTSGLAGSLRTRGSSTVEPEFRDAIRTYISHSMQMEHFIAYAEFVKELRAVVNRKSFKEAILRAGGQDAVNTLDAWVEHIDRGGSMIAARNEALAKFVNRFGGRLAQTVLFGKLFTLGINMAQMGGAAVNMPAHIYSRQLSRLSRGKLNWIKSLDTPYIRRRIKQMPPIIRQALESNVGMPNRIQDISNKMGMGISYSDGFFTASTYVMTLDYQMELAQKMNEEQSLGMTDQEIEDYARNETERIVDQVAQPTRSGARSRFENESDGVRKLLWNFASDSRKGLDLLVRAIAKGDIDERVGTGIYIILINSIGVHFARTMWRDMRDDEDDTWLDDRNWSVKGFTIGALTDPLYGFPFLGQIAQNFLLELAGEKTFDGTVLDVLPDAGPAIRRIFTPQDYFIEDNIDVLFSDLQKIFAAGSVGSKTSAGISAMMNALEDASKLIKNVAK